MKYPIVTKDTQPLSPADRLAIFSFNFAYARENANKLYASEQTGFSDEELDDAFNFKYGKD